MKLRPILLLATAALALAACGKRGDLERPAPLWGDKDKDKAAEAQPVRSNQARMPVPETQNVPIGVSPVETGKPDPVGTPPTEPHS